MSLQASMPPKPAAPDVKSRSRGLALAVAGCVAAGCLGWLASREAGPATQAGHIAPYTLPMLNKVSDQANIAFLQARIQKQPGDFSDLNLLAGAYVARARATYDPAWYLLAEQAARRSLANMPTHNDPALMALCQVAQARHDFKAAEALRQKISVEHPIAVRPLAITIDLATGKLDEAARLSDAAVQDSPSCASHVQRALVREARGDDAGANADYHWAIEREEAGYIEVSVLARAWLGRLEAKHGQLDTGKALYLEALRIAPNNGAVLTLLAALELRQGDAKAASKHYDQAVVAGLGAPAMMGLAFAEQAQGHAPEAARWRKDAEAALRRDLEGGGYGHRRDLARLLLDKHEPAADQEALKLALQELEQRQDLPTLLVLARAQERVGQWTTALATLARARATGAQDPQLLALAAGLEQAHGQPEQAKLDQSALSRLDPTYQLAAEAAPGLEATP